MLGIYNSIEAFGFEDEGVHVLKHRSGCLIII